ncbi:hypothetical protein Pcinc_019942 [Petrolisthes cinctipes]|uniref:Uncharacterized protein n=1 Tax=Petrolisthes cinctipes TaxID=88211 RepID=A0AAE1FK99_PETCI|nr:hypothetical protein Pcinc_019942 [Petrolisthes cinctipes]
MTRDGQAGKKEGRQAGRFSCPCWWPLPPLKLQGITWVLPLAQASPMVALASLGSLLNQEASLEVQALVLEEVDSQEEAVSLLVDSPLVASLLVVVVVVVDIQEVLVAAAAVVKFVMLTARVSHLK